METKKLFQRKKHRLGAFVFFISLIISACSSKENKKEIVTERTELKAEEQITEEDIEVTIDSLVGVWKYSEVRTFPKVPGVPPVGEILLGITEKHVLSFATNGLEELAGNLKSIPTNFAIKGSSLFPSDKISEADFKISFNSKMTKVYVLNENELVLGKGISEDNKPILYMYFKRVK